MIKSIIYKLLIQFYRLIEYIQMQTENYKPIDYNQIRTEEKHKIPSQINVVVKTIEAANLKKILILAFNYNIKTLNFFQYTSINTCVYILKLFLFFYVLLAAGA